MAQVIHCIPRHIISPIVVLSGAATARTRFPRLTILKNTRVSTALLVFAFNFPTFPFLQ